MARHNNGTQRSVLNAIKQGVSDIKAICSWVGIPELAARNAIRRLIDRGDVRHTQAGYVAVRGAIELEKVWR